MSAEYHGELPIPPPEAGASERDVVLARQKASDARRHAAAIGDYAAAEQWYDRERALDSQLALRDRQEVAKSRP